MTMEEDRAKQLLPYTRVYLLVYESKLGQHT